MRSWTMPTSRLPSDRAKHHHMRRKHPGANGCQKLMPTKCHCLVVEEVTFWPCCGWYCDDCKGYLGNPPTQKVRIT